MRWTEKQIEKYLESETRELSGADGRRQRATLFHMDWITYDAVRVDDKYTEAELVGWALETAHLEHLTFTGGLKRVLDWLDYQIRKQCGQL